MAQNELEKYLTPSMPLLCISAHSAPFYAILCHFMSTDGSKHFNWRVYAISKIDSQKASIDSNCVSISTPVELTLSDGHISHTSLTRRQTLQYLFSVAFLLPNLSIVCSQELSSVLVQYVPDVYQIQGQIKSLSGLQLFLFLTYNASINMLIAIIQHQVAFNGSRIPRVERGHAMSRRQ